MKTSLPIDRSLPEILDAWRTFGAAVVAAAPGAGKTTRVPAALLPEAAGKVLLVEPRRVAAAAASARMAALAGEECGETFGFQVRGESRCSRTTRMIALTPGVLLRKLQQDPELSGVDTVIFDEFHERSAESDLGFTLTAEVRRELRPDLHILVMSATIDADAPARLLGNVPVVAVPGREFPVRQLENAATCDRRRPAPDVARAVWKLYREFPGDLLAFLPGVGEIEAVIQLLAATLPPEALLLPLHGGLNLKEQNAVLAPTPSGRRKVVIATNVAESSLTIDGISIVVDSGLERRSRYVPASGISFLETVRISRASAAQRSGRAGRTGSGVSLRLWDEACDRTLAPFTTPEILECEQSRIALELAAWGAAPEDLRWIDPPPSGMFDEGRELLKRLGALDSAGRLSEIGKKMTALPVHPRIAALLLHAEQKKLLPLGMEIAALLEEPSGGAASGGTDLRERLELFRKYPEKFRGGSRILRQLRSMFDASFQAQPLDLCGALLACAYPEWVGKSRGRHSGVFLLRSGKAATLEHADTLAASQWIAAGEVGGASTAGDARIRLAAELSREELEELFEKEITERTEVEFSPERSAVTAYRIRRLGAIELSRAPAVAAPEEIAQAVLEAAVGRNMEFPPPGKRSARRIAARLRFAAAMEPERFGIWNAERFSGTLLSLAAPMLTKIRSFADLERADWDELMKKAAGFETLREIDRLFPDSFCSPAGANHPIDYETQDEIPVLRVRLQEMLGVTRHPTLGLRRLPLRIELLSPAQRPIQITSDLPAFWKGSYALVRKEMKSQYPKHEWPEKPDEADPMLRSVKRKPDK